MRICEYVQQIEKLPFALDELEDRLNSHQGLLKWAYLIHDKDTYEDGSPKAPHLHVEMKLASDNTPETIAKWFDDKPERIEKAHTRTHSYDNELRYLTHEIPSADGKYRYPDEDVKANFDFIAHMTQVRASIEEAKSRKKANIDDVLTRICNNEIPRPKIGDHITDLDRIRFKKQIEEAFRIRDEKIAREKVDRQMNVMYLTGASGTGKTTIAKMFAKGSGYDVFVSGSSNDPLQGYLGQECIILDDIRPSDWKINDLLKFLDNNTNSLVKSRYSNKLLNDCKLIILTSVLPIEDLYLKLQESESEPIEQLKRRCGTYVIVKEKILEYYEYDETTRNYKHSASSPNPVPFLVASKKSASIVSKLTSLVDDMMDGQIGLTEASNQVTSEIEKLDLGSLFQRRQSDETEH